VNGFRVSLPGNPTKLVWGKRGGGRNRGRHPPCLNKYFCRVGCLLNACFVRGQMSRQHLTGGAASLPSKNQEDWEQQGMSSSERGGSEEEGRCTWVNWLSWRTKCSRTAHCHQVQIQTCATRFFNSYSWPCVSECSASKQ